jgi:hypothetical protein
MDNLQQAFDNAYDVAFIDEPPQVETYLLRRIRAMYAQNPNLIITPLLLHRIYDAEGLEDAIFLEDEITESKSVNAGKEIGRGLSGSGFFSRLRGLFDQRLDYRPKDREYIASHRDWIIVEPMTIMRQPVESYVKKFVNVLTLGKFQDIVNRHYDEVFHLYLVMTLKSPDGSRLEQISIEKNQTIEINPFNKRDVSNAESFPIVIPQGLTFGKFLDTARASTTEDIYFRYDALSYNCQAYIKLLLDANGILALNPGAKEFLYQDLSELRNALPDYAKKIMRGITNLAGSADVLIHGYGLNGGEMLAW